MDAPRFMQDAARVIRLETGTQSCLTMVLLSLYEDAHPPD